MEDFGRASKQEKQAEALALDYRKAGLDDADLALCEYALKLTLNPAAAGESDVQKLREKGFSDAAITVAAQVIGYFNYINRIAEGLGVDDEDWMPEKYSREEWLERKANDWYQWLEKIGG